MPAREWCRRGFGTVQTDRNIKLLALITAAGSLTSATMVALGLMAAVPAGSTAQAGPISVAKLSVISSRSIGSDILGTVTLTQNGANEVDVDVSLIAHTDFINSGGPHTPFTFDLNVAPDSILVTSPLGGLFFPNYSGGANAPYGSFNYAIDYTGQNGGGHGNHGPLDFQVRRAAGISLANFIANGSGYLFSADVLGPAGRTGAIAANLVTVSDVPEPATIALLGGGLVALGVARRLRA